MNFEWHDEKAAKNLAKHGISFEEAETVFGDVFALVNRDDKHSAVEERWLIVGTASIGYILTVSYTMRDSKIRIISARRANEKEREPYQQFRAGRLGSAGV
ncbi:MAG: BrnT family toxin [Candidatus Kapaibacterium sp.]|nr:MAG: BrnT family toxin [Candidatus Kapabacteria bacterium]